MNAPDIAQWREAQRWFAKAEQDQNAARLMALTHPPLLDPAAYHCQQAAEKYLKGLLIAAGLDAPKTHDLQRLRVLLANYYPMLAPNIALIADITSWGTATRYPDFDGDLGISPEDITDYLGRLERLVSAIMALAPNIET